jgi:hypothetical protein
MIMVNSECEAEFAVDPEDAVIEAIKLDCLMRLSVESCPSAHTAGTSADAAVARTCAATKLLSRCSHSTRPTLSPSLACSRRLTGHQSRTEAPVVSIQSPVSQNTPRDPVSPRQISRTNVSMKPKGGRRRASASIAEQALEYPMPRFMMCCQSRADAPPPRCRCV